MKKIFIVIVLLIVAAGIFLNVTTKTNSPKAEGFKPLRDDALAQRFAPRFISGIENGLPAECYYRASVDEKGNIYIAYHPVWTYERNENSGFMPLLSRVLYTGGLKLQKVMFGKGDVEVVGITLNRQKKIVELRYETADRYEPTDFSVTHKDIVLTEGMEPPLCFRVISWNHLFDFVPAKKIAGESGASIQPKAEYFAAALWRDYEMVKIKETNIKKSRAHFIWEREGVE